MPPLESRFKTVAISLDAICLSEPAKPSTTKTTVRVFAILATFAVAGSREHEDEPPSTCGRACATSRELSGRGVTESGVWVGATLGATGREEERCASFRVSA